MAQKQEGFVNGFYKLKPLNNDGSLSCILLRRKKVTVGRSIEAMHRINSVHVSRDHAAFEQGKNGQWYATDLKSINGLFVNGTRVTPSVRHPINVGDTIAFSPTENGLNYELCVGKKNELESNDTEIESKKRLKIDQIDFNSVLAEKEKVVEQNRQLETAINQMKKELMQRDIAEVNLKLQIKAANDKCQEIINAEKEKMREEKLRHEEQLLRQVEEKEQALVARLLTDQQKLLLERSALKEELEFTICQENREKQDMLEKKLAGLEGELNRKEIERTLLEGQLAEMKDRTSIETAEQAFKIRTELLQNFGELIEMELQCNICSELFIRAVALNCSHQFCSYCINKWRQNKNDCPVCRADITTQTRLLNLDNFIERMVESLSDDMKKTRRTLVAERIELEKQVPEAPRVTTLVTPTAHRVPYRPLVFETVANLNGLEPHLTNDLRNFFVNNVRLPNHSTTAGAQFRMATNQPVPHLQVVPNTIHPPQVTTPPNLIPYPIHHVQPQQTPPNNPHFSAQSTTAHIRLPTAAVPLSRINIVRHSAAPLHSTLVTGSNQVPLTSSVQSTSRGGTTFGVSAIRQQVRQQIRQQSQTGRNAQQSRNRRGQANNQANTSNNNGSNNGSGIANPIIIN